MNAIPRWVLLASVLLVGVVSTSAQVTTGTPPFGSYTGGPDVINLANLNAHFTIPVIHKPGRGGDDFDYDLTYDTSIWYPTTVGGNKLWMPVSGFGWNGLSVTTAAALTGTLSYSTGIGGGVPCAPPNNMTPVYWNVYGNWVYTDAHGTQHSFGSATTSVIIGGCIPNYYTGMGPGSFTATATDGSGYLLVANGNSGTVYSSGGSMLGLPINAPPGSVGTTDRNGNIITSNSGVYTDTLGKTTLTITGGSSTGTTLTYTTPSGSSAYMTVAYTPYTIQTNFQCNGVAEYTLSNVYLVSSITLPDQTTSYQFTYEPTPGGSGQVTGRLKSITFPTGGKITYNYTGGSNGITCSDGSEAGFTRTMPDGSVWTFARGTGTTTVTAPQLPYDNAPNQTVYTFTGLRETSHKFYQGSSSGTPLRTINTTWNSFGPTSQITILEDGTTQSEVDTNYDGYGNLLSVQEYDWGSGARGALARTTTNTYVNNQNYLADNLVSLLQTQTVKDASGIIKSRVDFAYDGTTMTCRPTPVTQHDDSGHICGFTYRGNQTTVTTYTDPVTPSGATARNIYYDQLGNAVSADLSCCQQKQWNYSTTTNYAYPDSIVSGSSAPQLTTSATYDLNMGLVLTSTDQNNQVMTYSYDNMGRVTNILRPDGQNLATSYTDSANNWSSTTCSPISSSTSGCQQTLFDNMGRAYEQKVLDGTSTVYSVVQTQYDALGRQYKVSNPYTGSSQNWSETDYDALSRSVRTILPDGTTTSPSYSLNTVIATDPAGKQMKSRLDGLGRLAAVYEPDVNNGNALTQQTSYAYDALDDLTQVTQGLQTRTYGYDALARLTSATTPEAGTVLYQYNSYNLLTQRQDARGVITTYSYDSLNRPTGVSYNVGSTGVPVTHSVTLTYGTTASQNNSGRLLGMTDGVGSESYSYDVMGNLTQLTKVINGQTYTFSYSYNYAGELATLIYPSGRVLQQNYDAIGRLCGVGAPGTSCTSVTAYTSGLSYNAAGQLTALTYGNGVAASMGYSSDRLQLQSLSYSKGTSTLFSTNYWYKTDSTNCPLAPAGNNGQIQCIKDNTPTNSDSGRSAAYGYDALYRLISAVTAGSTTYPQWGLSWTYDRYGNRTKQTVTAGTAPSNQLTFATTGGALTNHPDNFPFDANGNMTNDGTNTMAYDAENHLVSSSGTLGSGTYSFDGNGLRVQKVSGGTTTVYVFSGSKVLAEYTNGGIAPSVEYVYSGSQLTASIASASYNGSAASGTAEVGGSEQVIPGTPATPGTGAVSISGSEQSAVVNMCPNSPPYNCPQTVYDSGTVTVTVNGFHASAGYGSGSTANSLASSVASALNASGSPVTATANGSIITLVAKTTGPGSNYSVSTSVSYDSSDFSHPSFTASGSNLTGGAAAVATVYDTGTTWVTVNGFQALWTYGQNDTPTTVAASIASIFNTNNSSPVTAVATNGSLSLTSKTSGSGGNYPLSGGCSTIQPSTFSHASFCVSESGTTLGWTATTYYQGDHLSVRLITDSNGVVIGERGNYPYGETWYEPNATTKWKFTAYERDPESGNDYAMARTYINRFGRFSSPDPLSSDVGNPQSLNRYAYALNDPIDLNDPSGAMCSVNELGEANLSYGDCFGGGGGAIGGGGGGAPYWAAGDPLYGGDPWDAGYAQYEHWLNWNWGEQNFITFSYVPREDNAFLFLPLMLGIASNPAYGPWELRSNAVALLRAKNDCSAWFNNGTGSAADVMSQVPILVYTPKEPYYDMPDAGTGDNPQTPINVNSLGRFYTDRYNWNSVGGYSAGSFGARMVILLHELAHKVMPPGLIADDAGTPGASDKNTQIVFDHCAKAIDAQKQ